MRAHFFSLSFDQRMGNALSLRVYAPADYLKTVIRKFKSAKLENRGLYAESLEYLQREDVIKQFEEIFREENPHCASAAIIWSYTHHYKILEMVLWSKNENALIVTFDPSQPKLIVAHSTPVYSPPHADVLPPYEMPEWEPVVV